MTLDTQTAWSQLILEAKTSYLTVVKEAKTTRDCLVQEAEATCSKAICEAEAQKISQAAMLHKEHGEYMQDLEEQATVEESGSHNDFLSACQVILYSSPPSLIGALGCLISHPTRADSSIASTCPTTEDPPWKNSQLLPFHPYQTQTVPQAQKVTPFTRSHGEHTYRWCHSEGHLGMTPHPQEARDPSLVQDTQTQPEGNTFQSTPTILTWMATAISPGCLSIWQQVLAYWALLSSKPNHPGWDQKS